MAELRDNELNEVNGGKAQMDAWDLVFKSNNPEEEGFYHDGKDVEADWKRP